MIGQNMWLTNQNTRYDEGSTKGNGARIDYFLVSTLRDDNIVHPNCVSHVTIARNLFDGNNLQRAAGIRYAQLGEGTALADHFGVNLEINPRWRDQSAGTFDSFLCNPVSAHNLLGNAGDVPGTESPTGPFAGQLVVNLAFGTAHWYRINERGAYIFSTDWQNHNPPQPPSFVDHIIYQWDNLSEQFLPETGQLRCQSSKVCRNDPGCQWVRDNDGQTSEGVQCNCANEWTPTTEICNHVAVLDSPPYFIKVLRHRDKATTEEDAEYNLRWEKLDCRSLAGSCPMKPYDPYDNCTPGNVCNPWTPWARNSIDGPPGSAAEAWYDFEVNRPSRSDNFNEDGELTYAGNHPAYTIKFALLENWPSVNPWNASVTTVSENHHRNLPCDGREQ